MNFIPLLVVELVFGIVITTHRMPILKTPLTKNECIGFDLYVLRSLYTYLLRLYEYIIRRFVKLWQIIKP